MDIFLRAKAWQIFLVFFVLPFAAQMMVVQQLIIPGETNLEIPAKIDLERILSTVRLITALYTAIILTWFWALGVGINRRIPLEIRPSVAFFKLTIIFVAVYMLVFLMLFASVASGTINVESVAYIFPFHFFAMYCMFYSPYFIAKNLKTYESGRPLKYSDFSGTFYLLGFFPIGIWVLQPRINRLYESTTN